MPYATDALNASVPPSHPAIINALPLDAAIGEAEGPLNQAAALAELVLDGLPVSAAGQQAALETVIEKINHVLQLLNGASHAARVLQ